MGKRRKNAAADHSAARKRGQVSLFEPALARPGHQLLVRHDRNLQKHGVEGAESIRAPLLDRALDGFEASVIGNLRQDLLYLMFETRQQCFARQIALRGPHRGHFRTQQLETGIHVTIPEHRASPLHGHRYLFGQPESLRNILEVDCVEPQIGCLHLQVRVVMRLQQLRAQTDDLVVAGIDPRQSLNQNPQWPDIGLQRLLDPRFPGDLGEVHHVGRLPVHTLVCPDSETWTRIGTGGESGKSRTRSPWSPTHL